MKKQFQAFILFSIIALGATAFVSYNMGKTQKDDTMSLQSATNLMTEEWQEVVIIRDECVVYSGSPKGIDESLKGLEVQEIANCDDTFAITIFVE